jgi:hypothetical protein
MQTLEENKNSYTLEAEAEAQYAPDVLAKISFSAKADELRVSVNSAGEIQTYSIESLAEAQFFQEKPGQEQRGQEQRGQEQRGQEPANSSKIASNSLSERERLENQIPAQTVVTESSPLADLSFNFIAALQAVTSGPEEAVVAIASGKILSIGKKAA